MTPLTLQSYVLPDAGLEAYHRINKLRPTFQDFTPTATSASGRPVSVRQSGVRPGTYNAQTLPLGDPNIAAQNYDVTTDNAADKWGKIWANRTNKAGGSRQIFDKVSDWASPEKILARGGSPKDLQWQLMGEAIRTGRVDPRLKPELLRRGMGVGLSETARYQQHKPKGFLKSPFGVLAMSALTAAFGGPLLSAAVKAGSLGSLGAYLPAAKIAAGAKTVSDFAKATTP